MLSINYDNRIIHYANIAKEISYLEKRIEDLSQKQISPESGQGKITGRKRKWLDRSHISDFLSKNDEGNIDGLKNKLAYQQKVLKSKGIPFINKYMRAPYREEGTHLHQAQSGEIVRAISCIFDKWGRGEDYKRQYWMLGEGSKGTALQCPKNVGVIKALVETVPGDPKTFVRATEGRGHTPLFYVTDKESAEVLINVFPEGEERKNFVRTAGKKGATALFYEKKSDAARLLIETFPEGPEREEFVGMRDENGRTALFFTTDKDVIELLIEAFPDGEKRENFINIKDIKGYTAGDYLSAGRY